MRSKNSEGNIVQTDIGQGWIATSGSKSMACSNSDHVNVGDPVCSSIEGGMVGQV